MALKLGDDRVSNRPEHSLVVAPPSDEAQPTASPNDRLDELAQIIQAYNDAAEKLQHSHESLRNQVVRLQSQLASTNAQLQRSKRLAALGEMAAGIAHEVRNPLGAIQLYAGMLVNDLSQPPTPQTDHPAMADTARKIAAAVRGLDAIVSDVLSFARELSPKPSPVSVGQLFDRALDACRPMLTAGEVGVHRHDDQAPGASELLWVSADRALMHQALLNVIRNAADAMSPRAHRLDAGVRPAGLTLEARREGSQVVLTVRDTGPGIKEADIDRIFNPFFTTRNTGTGLGLAIVHRIVDAHSGTISVYNDHGAVFELSLPAACQESSETESVPQRCVSVNENYQERVVARKVGSI